jgi:prepilin-type N-terminal cleavage/methylation domain-containing protein
MKMNNLNSREILFFLKSGLTQAREGTSPNLKKQGGFALIEVIVSMVILSLVLASAVGLLYSVSNAVEANRDRLTATYLAQECLELARNARDTAWRNHQPWDCAWQNNATCSEKSILSSIKQNPVKVNGQETKFSREFEVTPYSSSSTRSTPTGLALPNNNSTKSEEVMITCKVSWGEHSLSISEILTNWRKR